MWIAQRHSSEGDYRRVLNERENDLLALNEASGPRSNAHMAALREAHDAQLQERIKKLTEFCQAYFRKAGTTVSLEQNLATGN